jgi:hypothetical protein
VKDERPWIEPMLTIAPATPWSTNAETAVEQRGALRDAGVVHPAGKGCPGAGGRCGTLVCSPIGRVSEHDLRYDAVFDRAGARRTLEPDHDPAVGGEAFGDRAADALATAGHDDTAGGDTASNDTVRNDTVRGVCHLSPSRIGRPSDRA